MSESNLFEMLEQASANLAKSPHELGVTQRAIDILRKIYEFHAVISKDKKLSGIFVYKCLRMLQEADYLNVTFRIEQQVQNNSFQAATAKLRTILQALFKANTDFSVCGREFLRLALDRPLINEFMSNFMMDRFLADTSPDSTFLRLMVPKASQQKIDEVKSGSSSVKQVVEGLISHYNQITVHFLICDCIRYVLAVPALDYQQKAELVLELLDHLPHKEAMVTSFEVNLCLCLDVLTFTLNNKDRSAIKAFFEVYKQYNGLSHFIERVAKKYPAVALSVAAAMSVCKVAIPSNIIQWPAIEQEAVALDTSSILSEAMDKLKWSKRDMSGVLNDCAAKLMVNIFDKGPCELSVPIRHNDELNLIIKNGNVMILAKLCEKNSGVLRMTIYELGQAKSYAMLKDVISEVFKGEAVDTVFPSLSKVLVLQPELIETVAAVLGEAPPTADPSSFIRYMSYNCTSDELATLLQRPIFPKDPQQASQLLKDSLRWRQTAQCAFWLILRKAYTSTQHHNTIIDAFTSNIKPLSESPVAFVQIKSLLRTTPPLPYLAPLIVELSQLPGSAQTCVVAILQSWSLLFPDATDRFVKKKASTIRQFYNSLPADLTSEFPASVKDLLLNV